MELIRKEAIEKSKEKGLYSFVEIYELFNELIIEINSINEKIEKLMEELHS